MARPPLRALFRWSANRLGCSETAHMVILNRALSMLEIVSDHPDGVLLSYIATATELPLAIAYRLPRARLCGWS
jgi:hypothetical protein